MTASTLRSYSVKDLEQLAKRRGVDPRGKRKDELVKAILRKLKSHGGASNGKKSVAARPALRGTATKSLSGAKSHSGGASKATARASINRVAASRATAARATVARGKSLPLKVAVKAKAIKPAPKPPAKAVAVKPVVVKAVAVNGAAKHPAPAKISKPPAPKPTDGRHPGASAVRMPSPQELAQRAKIAARIEQERLRASRSKNLAFGQISEDERAAAKDRLVLMVRGPYWLHAYWDLTATGIARAQAALGQNWHQARPILRLLIVADSSTTSSEQVVRDIPIHGGVKNWYLDVTEPAQTYRIEIGYLAPGGKFFSLARSNVVTTPTAAASDSLDSHWNDVLADCDKIYAMSGGYSTEGTSELQELFEERLRRPMGAGSNNRFGAAVDGLLPRDRKLRFHVDAEIVIHGQTQADAGVTLQGEPLKIRPDGTFSVRLDLPNRRQVIPIVASTKDGLQQRTIVLAVERNTKVMEPLTRESTSE